MLVDAALTELAAYQAEAELGPSRSSPLPSPPHPYQQASRASPEQRVAMAVTLHTTHGDLKFELFCQACPKTTYNFLALCASGQYDGSPFHRNIRNFMVQAGSPASGTVKDNESIYGGTFEDEIKPSLKHHGRGLLSMANKGPATNGSQFFITYTAAPHLDGKNTIFGRLLEGDATLDDIEAVEVDKKNRPLQPVKIVNVQIHANPLADQR
ncbi:hypothetical protein AMS68_005183 [Peltaster fructicola]|uniref:Peptidyl-prolyl cis-trans isomerase n=1 Tax=Peltaster fructicola TaxID=286661 RepID=A0A6H0XYA6_9PEZI|nr:hypothetical protein AMS68_005183 [Peltaster fructicola]